MAIPEGYSSARAKYLTESCKWHNRIFKRDIQNTDGSEFRGKITGFFMSHAINWHMKEPLLFRSCFSEYWFRDTIDKGGSPDGGLAFLFKSYCNKDTTPMDFIESLFCEDMFEPKIQVPKSNKLAERLERPSLTMAAAEVLLNCSLHLDREFISSRSLEILEYDYKLPFNLWSYITVNPYKTLREIMNIIAEESPIAWNGIISDLAWNDLQYSGKYLKEQFTDDMFLNISPVSIPPIYEATVKKSKNLIELEKQSEPIKIGKKISIINVSNPTLLKTKTNAKIKN